MKKFLIGAATAGLLLSSAAGAFAANNYNPPTALNNTPNVCWGAGAFGAFGPGNNFGNSTSGHISEPGNNLNGNGANGPQTGSNNSNLCGTPQS